MKQFVIQIFFLLIVIFSALLYSANPRVRDSVNNFFGSLMSGGSSPTNSTEEKRSVQVKINSVVVKAELADTVAKRSVGLSGRESLGESEGMLFTFSKSDRHRFWMKGMKIPLDLIWISENKIVDIHPNVQPPALGTEDNMLTIYQPKNGADRVLEVNAGFSAKNNIQEGDQVEIGN